MDALLGLLCIGVLVGGGFFLAIAVQNGKSPMTGTHAATRAQKPPARAARGAASVHHPPTPIGQVLEPWSKPTLSIEVAGESYRRAEIASVFRGLPIHLQGGHEINERAVLVPDPHNPFDTNAVAIYMRGMHVGYLPAEDARVWHRRLMDLTMSGRNLSVEARAWARLDETHTVRARVTLRMPEASSLEPTNGLPSEPHVVLPMGSTIQVTKEDEHMAAISPLLDARGAEVSLAATLHAIVDIRPRSAVEAVQVRVGDEPVGVLSKVASENLLPLVKHVHSAGKVSVARATLRGNTLKADITLHVAKAQDLDPAWVASIGPVVPSQPNVAHRPPRPDPEW